jgi:hypothetical protein
MAPILAVDQAGVGAAWRRTWAIISADKLGFAGYILVKMLLSFAAAIFVGVLALLLLIPALGVAIVGGITTAGSISWTPQAIASVAAVGLLFLAWFMACMAIASVPFTVFFPAYGLHFLASRYEPLNAWLTTSYRASPVDGLPSTVDRPPSTVGRPPSTGGRPPSTGGRPPSTVGRPPSSV